MTTISRNWILLEYTFPINLEHIIPEHLQVHYIDKKNENIRIDDSRVQFIL